MNQNSFKPYWASVEPKEIADNILDKVEDFYKYLSMSGRLDLLRKSWAYYYRPLTSGGQLNPVGQQGELTAFSINNYRNYLGHLETLTLQQRVSFEPKATNSDVKSQSQVILATGLLDYYMREKRVERNMKQAVKDSLIFAEGFLRLEWDATSGEVYGQTPMGAPAYQGDVKYTNYTPFNVIRDYTKESPNQEDWYILRDFQNKYDLAAKYPEIADKILEDADDVVDLYSTTLAPYMGLEESDNIAVYTLLHEPSPALPQGRFTTCLGNRTILMDGPLPYEETHVYRIAPDEQTGSIFGYTVAFDLLSIQQAEDILNSSVLTNQSTFGVQNILVPKGHDLSTSQMSGGLNVMEYDPKVGKPEALNLTQTPPEIFNYIKDLGSAGQTIARVDSVTMGNPDASLKSGSALALVAAQSVQSSMGLQDSYRALVEDVGSGTIYLLQDFAAVPRVAEIAGKSNRPLMKEFSGQDLGGIRRVEVDMGNPLTRTTAGKVNLADAFLEKGLVTNPDQYIQVVTTGRLEPLIEGKQAQLLLIKAENEGLSEGQPQRAIITDNHAQHILEHGVVNASPEARQDPNSPALQATLAHIQEHLTLAQSPGYQMIAQMLGHQLMAPPAAPPAPGGGAGQMLDSNTPGVKQAQGVQPPNMPNPPPGTPAQSADIIQGQQAS